MSIADNKEFIRRYLEAISGRPKSAATLDLYMSDVSLKEHIRAAEAAFPLYRLDAEEMIAEGDLVSVRARVRGTQLGEFQGLPPTGKSVDFAVFLTYRIANGKIIDHWMLTDTLTLMQQLGVMPAAEGQGSA